MIIGFVRKFVGILYQKHDYYCVERLLCPESTFMKAYETAERKVVAPVAAHR